MLAEVISLASLLASLSCPERVMVERVAGAMGVDPAYAACVAYHESGFDPAAVGDNGRALGLYQWHYPSWVHVRRAMGLSTDDMRDDAVQATVTAMWAWRNGYRHWWTTAEGCEGAICHTR